MFGSTDDGSVPVTDSVEINTSNAVPITSDGEVSTTAVAALLAGAVPDDTQLVCGDVAIFDYPLDNDGGVCLAVYAPDPDQREIINPTAWGSATEALDRLAKLSDRLATAANDPVDE